MKIQKNYLYKVILQEYKKVMEDVVPGNAPPNKQVHVFDFDDTLGVTDNPNGVMVYAGGKPAHKDEASLKAWLTKNGLSSYLLAPKGGTATKEIKNRGGWAAYLTSAGLAKIQSTIPKQKQFVTGVKEPTGDGEELLIDFTPSSFVDQKTTEPIQSTINKLKTANSKGSLTAVMTARKGEGSGTSFDGTQVPNTNTDNIEKYLSDKGAKPSAGVMGVSGQNKGDAINKKFGPNKPDEIHFYDDLSKNTGEVEAAVGGKSPSELYIYGPGEFAHNQADPNKPNKSIPGTDDKEQTTSAVKESEKGNKKMKITKESLKRIINQEVEKVLSEGKKMKVTIKGKKKSMEMEGALGANYDDYDYVRDSAPSKMNPWDIEAEEARRKEMQKYRDEEREAELRRYREMSDYDRSSRSDESMDPKKKVKN